MKGFIPKRNYHQCKSSILQWEFLTIKCQDYSWKDSPHPRETITNVSQLYCNKSFSQSNVGIHANRVSPNLVVSLVLLVQLSQVVSEQTDYNNWDQADYCLILADRWSVKL